MMLRYGALVAIFACIALSAQINQKSVPGQKPSIDRIAEDRVAQAIDAMRQQEGLRKLKRRRPSREEVQLVCTAAVTGSTVSEPKFGAVQVYSTGDLSAPTESLKLIAFGTSYDRGSGTRYRVYSDKDWGSYMVIVYSSLSASGALTFSVGASRHSRINDLFGWITFDHPCRTQPIGRSRLLQNAWISVPNAGCEPITADSSPTPSQPAVVQGEEMG